MSIRWNAPGTALPALLAVPAVIVTGATVPGGPEPAHAADPAVLTVSGNGQVRTFSMSQLEAMPQYSGYFGSVDSIGRVVSPTPVKGVRLADLVAEIGDMATGDLCDVAAADGYDAEYTHEQVVRGLGVQLFDAVTKAEEDPEAPASLVVVYEQDGGPLPSAEGPLRLVVAQETDVGQVADAYRMVRGMVAVTLREGAADWRVKMLGLKKRSGARQTCTLDRASFEGCAATPACHGRTWTHPATKLAWSGVPLYLCVGRVDGGPSHGSSAAYNELLAMKGYRIKIVSATGKYAIIGSRAVRRRTDVVLANKLMDADLTSRYSPLRLVGPSRRVPSAKSLGRITRIILLQE